jgi:hypothetical protein
LYGFDAEIRGERVGHAPRQYLACGPVHHRDQIVSVIRLIVPFATSMWTIASTP